MPNDNHYESILKVILLYFLQRYRIEFINKMGISNAMDGTEKYLLGMSSDEEDYFDEFTNDAVDYAANIASAINNIFLSKHSNPQDSSAELDSDSDNMTAVRVVQDIRLLSSEMDSYSQYSYRMFCFN